MRTLTSLDERLSFVFRLVLCREAMPSEVERLRVAYQKQQAIYSKDLAGARAFLSVGESPLSGDQDLGEHAALTAVCLAIFNLDEALTRE